MLPCRASLDVDRPRFPPGGPFHRDVKYRIERYFQTTGRSDRDLPAMYRKTAIILGWFACSWALLVCTSPPAWLAAVLAVSLGLAVAAIGMAVMHDANHGGYSRRVWVNRVLGATLDFVGASSYVWRVKHNAIHHTFTNIAGHDDDLDIGRFARLAPDQPWRPWHRYQHLYLWALYGFLLPKWVFVDDFVNLAKGRVGRHELARPDRSQVVGLVAGKLVYVTWSLAVPMALNPAGAVIGFFLLGNFVAGVTLAVTFQLAHCVDAAKFPVPETGRLAREWAVHQLETTVDFAPGNRLLTWFVGGLNFQVEHHLCPRICHLHYPALARLVAETAREHGLLHRSQRTLWAAITSHHRYLKSMGQPARPPDAFPVGAG